MIKANDACKTAVKLLGTPYEQCDCNMLLIRIIRESIGGKSDYRCANVNWLYHSYENSGKYKYITSRELIAPDLSNCRRGQFVGRVTDDKCYHMGIYMGGYNGFEVIHSPHSGRTVEGTTVAKSGFTHVMTSKYITPGELSTSVENPVDNPDNMPVWLELYYQDFMELDKLITTGDLQTLKSRWSAIRERTLSND